MANPETQTLTTIKEEGLRKAGVIEADLATDPDYTEASTTWIEEIKDDIQLEAEGNRLLPLQTVATLELQNGQSRYSMPTNMMIGSPISIELLYGTQTFNATSGSTTADVILDSGHGLSTASACGKEIYCYNGTGPLNEIREIESISSDTITVTEAWTDAPDDEDDFFLVEEYKRLQGPRHIGFQYQSRGSFTRGEPTEFWIRGDSDYGEFQLFPTPYRTDTVPYVVRMFYYVDLSLIDVTSTLISTLYRLWRNIFVWGIYVRKLQRNKDTRYEPEHAKYIAMIRRIVKKYTYENNVTDLQGVVDA